MSDDGPNVTEAGSSDYLFYYGDYVNFAPCEAANVSSFAQVFLPTLYSLVFILGFLGNGLVLCVLVKHRCQTNLTDICLLNLALSDLLFVLTLPLYAHYAVVGEWVLGDVTCRLAGAAHDTGYFCSVFCMVVMTLDRYVVITHALTVARYRTVRAGVALTAVVWILSLSVSLPAVVFTQVIEEPEGLRCGYVSENRAWGIYSLFSSNILGLLIPLLVMVACYSRIIPTLVKMKTAKKHRVVKLIISIMFAFFIFWAPYNTVLLLRFLKDEGKLAGEECSLEAHVTLALTVTEAFAYTHCCLNPIIYAFVGQKFMKRAMQMLRDWVPGIHSPSSRDLFDSSYRKSSVMSRSSDITSTIIK